MKKIIYFFVLVGMAAYMGFMPCQNYAAGFGDPLVDAAEVGDQERVNQLLRGGHYVDKTGEFGTTALMRAAVRCDVGMVKRLIKAGAYVNAVDFGGETSLHLAARKNNAAIIKQLLDAGAKIETIDKEGWTPLMRAVSNGKAEVVQLLVAAGADIAKENSNGNSALKYAVKSGKENLLKILAASPSVSSVPAATQKSLLILAKQKKDEATEAQLASMFKTTTSLVVAEKEPSENNASDDIANVQAKPKKTFGYLEPQISVRDETSRSKGSYEAITSNVLRKFKEKEVVAASPAGPLQEVKKIEEKAIAVTNAVAKDVVTADPVPVLKDQNKKLILAREPAVERVEKSEKEEEARAEKPKKIIEAKSGIKGLPWKKGIDPDVILPQKAPAPTAGRPAPGMSYPVSWVPIAPLPVPAQNKDLLIAVADKIPQTLFVIQLGVFASKDEAATAWYGLRAKYEDILGNIVPVVKRVTLARDNKTLFRLRAGSFSARSDAEKLCSALNVKNVECFVVDKANELRGALNERAKVARAAPAEAPSVVGEVKKIESPPVVVASAEAQAPISLAPPVSKEMAKAEAPVKKPEKVLDKVSNPSVPEEVTVQVDQSLPWLTTPLQTPVPAPVATAPEAKIEVIATPVTPATAPLPVPLIPIVAKVVEQVKASAPEQIKTVQVKTVEMVKKEEPVGYSTAIEEMPWVTKPPVATAPVLPAIQNQTIQKQTQAVLANRENLAQVPLKDFEEEYANITPEPLNNGQFRRSSVSEAVMVADDGYYNNPSASVARTGEWLKIGLFDSQQLAEDYYNRMFKFNADLQQVRMEMVSQEKGFSKGKTALRVGPVDIAQAPTVCKLAKQNKLDCDRVNGVTSGTAIAGMSSLPAGRRPVNRDMIVPVAVAQGEKWIQLGTFSNKSEAEYYWMFLQEDHQNTLRGLRHDLQNIVHGAFGGSAIGLKAGPFPSEDQAMQVCRSLSSQNVACAVAMN